jgi:hypothetical protein
MPRAARTPRTLRRCPSFKGQFLSPRAKPQQPDSQLVHRCAGVLSVCVRLSLTLTLKLALTPAVSRVAASGGAEPLGSPPPPPPPAAALPQLPPAVHAMPVDPVASSAGTATRAPAPAHAAEGEPPFEFKRTLLKPLLNGKEPNEPPIEFKRTILKPLLNGKEPNEPPIEW